MASVPLSVDPHLFLPSIHSGQHILHSTTLPMYKLKVRIIYRTCPLLHLPIRKRRRIQQILPCIRTIHNLAIQRSIVQKAKIAGSQSLEGRHTSYRSEKSLWVQENPARKEGENQRKREKKKKATSSPLRSKRLPHLLRNLSCRRHTRTNDINRNIILQLQNRCS